MPGSPPPAGPFVYQLRVVLRGVSPLIWRRLLVRSNSSIADLHATLQLAFGWSDEHLHRFVVHGREYGVAHPGGLWFRDDPHEVQLADLGLRVGERFLYEYDFFDGWCHDIGWRRSWRSNRVGATRSHQRRSLRPAGGMRRAAGLPGAAPLLAAPAHRAAGGAPRGRPRLSHRRDPRRSLRGVGGAVPLVAGRP